MDSAYIKFNGGIWSEVLKGRYDLGNYKSAARTCENFIPTRYGQVEKRAGTKHLGYAKNNDKACVLHPFQFSVNTKFILELGEQSFRFWSNDLQVETAPDTPLEVVTPYLESELYELQIRAVNDVVYIVHPNHPVAKLTRFADDNWTYTDASLNLPFVDPDVNSTVVTLTPSATTGNITIAASDDVFSSDYVGSEVRLKYLSDASSFGFSDNKINANAGGFDPLTSYVTGDRVYTPFSIGSPSKKFYYTFNKNYTPTTAWSSATTYALDDLVLYGGSAYVCKLAHAPSVTTPDIATGKWTLITTAAGILTDSYVDEGALGFFPKDVSGAWSLKTTGTWNGSWAIQRSIDGGATWSTIKVLASSNDSNYLVEEDEEGTPSQIRVLGISSNWSGFQYQTVTFSTLTTDAHGTAEITSVVDAQNVNATVLTELPSAASPALSWQESAFSERQGYPRTIALFDNRLLLAGTKKKPQAFFYSEINNYNNFLAETTQADAPFFVETLSEDQSSVQWLTTQRELFVGTASVEGVLTTRKQDEAQSPENLPIVRWNEAMGSAHRAALPLRDSLLVLQRGRTVLNMISYSLEKDGYTGEEVSLLCPHLFSSGVLQMAHLREPYTGAFTVQEDGTLCHMIYEPKLEVTGWCKYTTQSGNFESIAVLPSSGNESTDEDEVWVSVERTINGTTRRHIEHFQVGNTTKQEASDADNMWYLDAAVKPVSPWSESNSYAVDDVVSYESGQYICTVAHAATVTDPATNTGQWDVVATPTVITGLDHLDGATVCVLADGIKGSYIVSSGSITLSVPADTVLVGLPVTSEFEPFDLEVQFKGGDTYGKRKQLYDSKLMVWRSLGGSIAHDGQDYQDLIYHTAGETMDESVPLKDGWIEVFHESSYARQKYWRIKHDEPYPFTLQAVIQSFTVSKS